MIPVLVIRPQPGCDATVAAAGARGLEAQGFPLFTIEPVAWNAPDPAGVDALLIGSANALRHGGAALEAFRGKPAYAVGETTAEAARAAGLDVVATGRGGLQAVLDKVPPEHARLLRLAGEERLHLTAPAGVSLCERMVYASRPQPMPPGLAPPLDGEAVVLLHSAEAARHFAAECDRLGLSRAGIHVAAIGPRVAEAAGSGWASLDTAATPDDGALLALADELCHTVGSMNGNHTSAMQDEPLISPLPAASRPRSGWGPGTLIIALLAILLGGCLAGWLVWRGDLDAVLPPRAPKASTQAIAAATLPVQQTAAGVAANVDAMEARVAILDKRLAQLGTDADEAAGNATRAESLLIVAATRRLIEKGAPLGSIGDQLKLRFGDSQPNAVKTVLEAARAPITLDELNAQLDAMTPQLTETPEKGDTWARVQSEVSNLFVVRREKGRAADPAARVERARLMLAAGKVERAIAEVQRLPGAEDAGGWIANARRYDATQRALDLIETAAILMPVRKPELVVPVANP